MHLFVRRARLAGGQSRAAMMWAEEITDRVNQVTDLGFLLVPTKSPQTPRFRVCGDGC